MFFHCQWRFRQDIYLKENIRINKTFVSQNFREIWSRFLAFESEVGDLACIQKVEKRRAQAIEKVWYTIRIFKKKIYKAILVRILHISHYNFIKIRDLNYYFFLEFWHIRFCKIFILLAKSIWKMLIEWSCAWLS